MLPRLIVLFSLIFCISPAFAIVLPPGIPDIEINHFKLKENKGDKVIFSLKANKAMVFKEQEVLFLNNIEFEMWHKRRSPYVLLSKSALMSTKNNELLTQNKTTILTPEGFNFETSNLNYNHEQSKISSKEYVEGNREPQQDISFSGKGLYIDLNLNIFSLAENVKAKQKVKGGEIFEISSTSSTILPDQQIASFTENVTLSSKLLSLKGSKLVLHYQKSTPESKSVFLKEILLSSKQDSAHKKDHAIHAGIEDLYIEATGLKIYFLPNGKLKEATAEDKVSVSTKENIKITSDKIIIKDIRGKKYINIYGNVTILHGDKKAVCKEASYDPEKSLFLLRKGARITKGSQSLEGEEILLSTKTGQITVKKAKGKIQGKELGKELKK